MGGLSPEAPGGSPANAPYRGGSVPMPSSPSIPMPMTPVYPSLHSSCPCHARWRRIGAPALRRPLVVCLVLGSLMLLPPAWAGFDEGKAAYLGGRGRNVHNSRSASTTPPHGAV